MPLLRPMFVTLTAVCLVAPGVARAGADVTISDWRGASVTATEGSVDSNGVKIVYHTGDLHAWYFAMTHPERTERLISLGSIHPAGLIRELG